MLIATEVLSNLRIGQVFYNLQWTFDLSSVNLRADGAHATDVAATAAAAATRILQMWDIFYI